MRKPDICQSSKEDRRRFFTEYIKSLDTAKKEEDVLAKGLGLLRRMLDSFKDHLKGDLDLDAFAQSLPIKKQDILLPIVKMLPHAEREAVYREKVHRRSIFFRI